MKRVLKITIIALLAAAAMSLNCSKAANTTTGPTNSIDKQTYRSVGVVKAIDIDTDRVTVDHEEIPGYMSPMEMNEMVADHELLGSIKVGDKVEFEIERTGSKVIYTQFKKIGTAAIVNGSEIYKTNCAECHGDKGQGAPKGIPFTSGHALDHTEADFIKSVTNGKPQKGEKEMPAFRDKLKPEEIAAVVKFVREDIQKGLKRNEGHKH